MAKELKQIFTNSDKVEQTFIINAWHVSQSVDAFTGIDDYKISVSGSMHITGTLSTDDDVFFSGLNSLPQNDVVVINTSDGQLFYTSSGAFKDYIYSASFNSSSAVLNFFGSGSAFNGSVDLSFLSDSVDYIYSASFDSSSAQLDFYGSGSGFTGTVDLSSLTGSVDYVYSASFDSSSGQLDFYGSGSGYNGSVDLSNLTGSVDYISNVSYDDKSGTLSFTGLGNAFDGDVSLSNLDDNGGGFTLNYSGSVVLNVSSWSSGNPQKVISTNASHITASGYNEWHFSDVGKSLFGGPGQQQQYDDDGLIGDGDTLFARITGSVTEGGELLVRIYDDKYPEYDFYYVNQGAAALGNAGSGGNDLILNLKLIGGRSYGQSNAPIPNGTNPNNANVSFAFIGRGGGGGSTTPGGYNTQLQYNNSSTFGGANLFYDSTNHWLGVNVPIPSAVLHVSGSTSETSIYSKGRVGVGVGLATNGFLEVDGDVTGTSIYASANIVAYSDARSKTNVTTIDNALDKVDAIRGVTYNKVDNPDGIRYMGVIAQELQEVLPEVVAEGEDGNLAVAYGNIVGVLIEAIKELRAEIKELKGNK